MSWPLASFALVGLVLLTGWLAYERSRPSARMVAVVATLAAVAALGRDAFIALPEVKPITAITLVVGYALGPLPGFSVGALGMLASNILLGQGSYTPWQMAAWGLVGLAGAALGRLSGGRLGRVPLALACCITALLAKEIMNVYTWTIGASHTPAALLAAAGAGLPFDLVDAVASLLFGLAFAPELARVLTRVRARMDVRWETAGVGAPLASVLILGCAGALLLPAGRGGSAQAQQPVSGSAARVRASSLQPAQGARATTHSARAARASLSRELGYLASSQDANGGFGAAPGQASSELYTAWAAIGLAATGRDPAATRRDGHSVLSALGAQASTLEGPGDLERTILALRACGASTGSLAGKNLLGGLLHYRASDGSFGHLLNITAFAIFALRAAGRSAGDPVVSAAAHWIAHHQDADGGYNFAGAGGASDVDDTAAALQGLVDGGLRSGSSMTRAVAFIEHAQNPDGGFPAQPHQESNAQSTAWAIQGLVAAGRDVEAVRDRGSRSPLGYLESLVAPNGSVRYSRTSAQTPVWVTAQALAALALKPFPVGPAAG
ncbi:MAG TPA: prenyltransferase/squalene oxidase repeat-containing protein [Solirubrobacteraceae bacterium]